VSQADLFGSGDPLGGLTVNLGRTCACGSGTLITGPGRGPHRACLTCSRCSRHCGWLSAESAAFITEIIESIGRPTEPIMVRRGEQ
jgi:hypothetical protein